MENERRKGGGTIKMSKRRESIGQIGGKVTKKRVIASSSTLY